MSPLTGDRRKRCQLKPYPHQQQCRSNIVECYKANDFFRQSRMLLRHCCRFWQHCCQKRQQCCRKRQQCRSSIRLCRKDEILGQTRSTLLPVFGNKVECCFDFVAGVDGALRTTCGCVCNRSPVNGDIYGATVDFQLVVSALLYVYNSSTDFYKTCLIYGPS